MAKKNRRAKVELTQDDFKEENAVALVTMKLPFLTVKELKRLSFTDEFGGKYQLLIETILNKYIKSQQNKSKRRSRSKG